MARAKPQDVGTRETSAAYLVTTYLLLLPLLVFAVHGGFSFEHGSWNSNLGAVGGKFAVVPTSAESALESMQSWTALAICIFAMAPYFRQIARSCMSMPLMLILPLYAMASALWSQDFSLSLRGGISLLMTTLFAFFFGARFSHRQQLEIISLTGSCIVAMSVALVLFCPQFGIDHQLHEGAWQGVFTQKNVCAGATLFLLTPALALTGRGRWGQTLRVSYISLCLLVIYESQSRTGWVITAIYLAFAGSLRVLGRFRRKDLLPLAALLIVTIAGTITAAVQYWPLLLDLASRSDGFSGRSEIWSAIVESILRHPIGGYGFDAFWTLLQGEASRVFSVTGWVVTGAHNGFLNVGLELGLVGLALVAATFVQGFRHAIAAFQPGRSPYVDWCIGIVFLTLIYNLDERTLMATQYLPWILYIVACTGLAKASRRPRSMAGSEGPA